MIDNMEQTAHSLCQIVDSNGKVPLTGQTTLQIKSLTDIRAEFQQFFPFLFTGQFTTAKGPGG